MLGVVSPGSYDAAVVSAVLFDIGGVILSSPFDAFARFEQERGLPAGFLVDVNTRDPDANAWARLERGELDPAAFGEAFLAESTAAGHPVHGNDVLALLTGEVRPAMAEAVRRCAARLATAFLTNNPAPMSARTVPDELAELLDVVDLVLESSVERVRKPEPAFYEMACERLGIEPHQAVFLDDLGMNLKPARAMGMMTIKVVEPEDAIAELERVVGFPLSAG